MESTSLKFTTRTGLPNLHTANQITEGAWLLRVGPMNATLILISSNRGVVLVRTPCRLLQRTACSLFSVQAAHQAVLPGVNTNTAQRLHRLQALHATAARPKARALLPFNAHVAPKFKTPNNVS